MIQYSTFKNDFYVDKLFQKAVTTKLNSGQNCYVATDPRDVQ